MRALGPGLPRYPSIVHALEAQARARPGELAIVCGERRLDYARLARAVAGVRAHLDARGLRGRRVAVAMPSGIEAVASVLGVLAAGARAIPINPFFTLPELCAVLEEADPEAVICGPEAAGKLLEILGPRPDRQLAGFGVRSAAIAPLDLDDWIDDESLWLEASKTDPEGSAVLVFTGGTTGVPKAVEHRHVSIMASLLQHRSVWPVNEDDRFLSSAPIFHVWGLFYATFVPIHCGGAQVIVPKYDPAAVLSALTRERITVFGGGPAPVYLGLLPHPAFATTDFSSLKYSLTGGAPCPAALSQEWQRRTGSPLLEGWGMSEAAPLCLNAPDAPQKAMSVGVAVPETEVEIVDVDTGRSVLPNGEPGEVRVRGPQLMLGYRAREQETRAVLRDGWLYTGDVGYLDDDGHLFLVDRKKDLVIVGGYNVYPRQVDEVLYRHPRVTEAACVGRPDPRLGEVLVAFVVATPGDSLPERELVELCQTNLVKYRRPVAFHFVDSLPRTAARKIDKKALRARALAMTGR